MGSDWDYINEHMGGHDEHGLPNFMKDPCFNDDWELKLREDGYKTMKEWNSMGISIMKGEKGKYLPCAEMWVFSESQTTTTRFSNNLDINPSKRQFDTFEKAASWAKDNPGKAVTRSLNGEGYIEK